VVALSTSLVAQVPGDMRWLRVEDPSAAAACRGAAQSLASRLRFPAARTDQLTLAVTEAATNLHKHASQGSMLLRIARDGGKPGIEMVTIDAGPGFGDAAAALRDGHSTSGTLGIGLGAIRRLADFCDLYSVTGRGTALMARFWPGPNQFTDDVPDQAPPLGKTATYPPGPSVPVTVRVTAAADAPSGTTGAPSRAVARETPRCSPSWSLPPLWRES